MPSKPRTSLYKATLPAGLALWVLLIAGWLVYRPGLHGAFHFDDWANLPALGEYGPIRSWHAVVTYLLSGIASTLGRPLAMLSFLLDANYWPAAPEPFLYTNILIHLLNGTLLAWVAWKLSRQLGLVTASASWVAIITAGLWLLHPLMVSTTLFVVQRMAMLAATFVFAGLLFYMHGRERLATGRPASGYIGMSVGVALCGLLATLSKENGALLPLFALNIEYFVFQRPTSGIRIAHPSRPWRLWKIVFLYVPLAAIALYLLARLPTMLNTYEHARDFTLGERLLTEGRVLVNYLYMLVIPHPYTAGLYHDDFTVSTSLLHPWTTLPSLLLIALLLGLAWRVRRRYPALALAVFFYFSGQLLESTIIPLELFYEHRNYLPAALFFFPLALWLVTTPVLKHKARVILACSLLALFAAITYARANLWGHPMQQAAVWARINPGSPRAQTTYALYLMHNDRYRDALHTLSAISHRHPGDIMIELNMLDAQCALGKLTTGQINAADHALAHAKIGATVAYHVISRFIHSHETGHNSCIDPQQMANLIRGTMANPNVSNARWQQQMLVLHAQFALSLKRPAKALALMKQALALAPRPGAALFCSALLGGAHYPAEGLALLDYYATLPVSTGGGFGVGHLKLLWLEHNHFYRDEIKRVRTLLQQDMKAGGHTHPSVR